jgi:hypothetical protein
MARPKTLISKSLLVSMHVSTMLHLVVQSAQVLGKDRSSYIWNRSHLQIGNAPTIIAKAQLASMLPRWDRTVRAIHADSEADRNLGWAQEMFGFALSLANTGQYPPRVILQQELMVQPPFQDHLWVDACAVRLLSSSW